MNIVRFVLAFILSILSILILSNYGVAQESSPRGIQPRPIGSIEKLDPILDALIPADAVIEVVAEGFKWSEGPVWLPQEQCLVFSDVPRNMVFSWSRKQGLLEYLKPSGFTGKKSRGGEPGANGLALDSKGRLLLCQHGDRRVARMGATLSHPIAKFVTLTSEYRGQRFNSPNDLVVHSNGTIFFTDPPYGLVNGMRDPAKELAFQGVYRFDPHGETTLLVKDLPRPNGIALSPDEKTLYVAQSHQPAKVIMAYDVDVNLNLSNARVFFDANELGRKRRGNPDGLKVDQKGNLFATGPGGVLVLSPSGKHLGTIVTNELIANCAFGDDGRTLYMTSHRLVCRIRLSTKGLGF